MAGLGACDPSNAPSRKADGAAAPKQKRAGAALGSQGFDIASHPCREAAALSQAALELVTRYQVFLEARAHQVLPGVRSLVHPVRPGGVPPRLSQPRLRAGVPGTVCTSAALQPRSTHPRFPAKKVDQQVPAKFRRKYPFPRPSARAARPGGHTRAGACRVCRRRPPMTRSQPVRLSAACALVVHRP